MIICHEEKINEQKTCKNNEADKSIISYLQ